jgi:hypothetical protein
MTEAQRYRERAAVHLVRGLYRLFFPRPMFDDGTSWQADAHFRMGVVWLELAEEAQRVEDRTKNCAHTEARRLRYVGEARTYKYCPVCGLTFEGEKTAAKKALVSAAAYEDPGEQGEPDHEENGHE